MRPQAGRSIKAGAIRTGAPGEMVPWGAPDWPPAANRGWEIARSGTAAGPGSGVSEIWVIAGIYYPAPADDPLTSSELLNGVTLHGGFAGRESSRDQRDIAENFVADPVYSLSALFTQGPAPALPYPDCGGPWLTIRHPSDVENMT